MSAADRPVPSRFTSQADEYLRRAIAAKPVQLPRLPDQPAARRRAINVRGW